MSMKVAVIGASGYAGAELIGLLCQHDKISIQHLVVSENSVSSGKTFSELYARWQGICDLPLQSFSQDWFDSLVTNTNDEQNNEKTQQSSNAIDAVFFATPHEFSAQWGKKFIEAGIKVFDLSGGFRLKNASDYPKYYQFEHQCESTLAQAQYGLAEWHQADIANAELIAVPGCYPTASLLALKPITNNGLQLENSLIVVNGISGVTGAGRKASLGTSFSEVSLTAYNILQHRHQPEISQEAQAEVIFNPHLAPYKRGLLVTITLQLKTEVTIEQINQAFHSAYQDKPLVRISATWPKIDDVAYTPFANLHWQFDKDKHILVVSCVIDNLLKGAASQALQCANIALGLPSEYSLLPNCAVQGVAQ